MTRRLRLLVPIAIFLSSGGSRATPATPNRGTMTDAITQICDFVSSHERHAMTVAQRFGMHLHDLGGNMNITFTPRDRRFSEGSANREWHSQALGSVDLTVAKDAILTVGELRAAFGTLRRSDGEHFNDPPRFIATIDRDPKAPLACVLTVLLQAEDARTAPDDRARVKRLTIVPGPHLATSR